ncbi:MAG: hypothetical protein LBU48_02530, partial [Coriobacteriales bacterium]|nr:hypothetical protein [Coriobacteriales bacterium]
DIQHPPSTNLIIDPFDEFRRKELNDATHTTLLKPLARGGTVVWEKVGALAARSNTQANIAQLHASNKRFLNPHSYPVGLEPSLHEQRDILLKAARGIA